MACLVIKTYISEMKEHEQRFNKYRQQCVQPSASGPQSTSTRLPLWVLTPSLYTERWGRQSFVFCLQTGCGDWRYGHSRPSIHHLPILAPSTILTAVRIPVGINPVISWWLWGRRAPSLNWQIAGTLQNWEVTHWGEKKVWQKTWGGCQELSKLWNFC